MIISDRAAALLRVLARFDMAMTPAAVVECLPDAAAWKVARRVTETDRARKSLRLMDKQGYVVTSWSGGVPRHRITTKGRAAVDAIPESANPRT